MSGKRIFICHDGTDDDDVRDQNGNYTNVARFLTCLRPSGSDGKRHLVYYHRDDDISHEKRILDESDPTGKSATFP